MHEATTKLFTFFCLILASLAPALAVKGLYAQQDQGGVTGIIKDGDGAVVVNATVTLTEVDQGFTLTRKTNANGIFQFTPIKVGNYSVTVAASGCATETELVVVDVPSNVNVPFTHQAVPTVRQKARALVNALAPRPVSETRS